MTNDEIRERACAAYVSAFRARGTEYDDFIDAISEAIKTAVSAALEEAAKVALDHECKRDYCSAACVFGVAQDIRALKPVTK